MFSFSYRLSAYLNLDHQVHRMFKRGENLPSMPVLASIEALPLRITVAHFLFLCKRCLKQLSVPSSYLYFSSFIILIFMFAERLFPAVALMTTRISLSDRRIILRLQIYFRIYMKFLSCGRERYGGGEGEGGEGGNGKRFIHILSDTHP